MITSASLPLRERGLKHALDTYSAVQPRIAPPAGARIETTAEDCMHTGLGIAPPAGARIETDPLASPSSNSRSLPLRERGLKQEKVSIDDGFGDIAPPAGARIETASFAIGPAGSSSLPLRERGLKL